MPRHPAIAPPPRNWPADKVKSATVASLEPYARNSRTHSPEQVSKIARSIEQFGFTNPILVDEQGTIIAGHGRVMAAKKLRLTSVPVMVATGWTEAQKRAYVIADNKLGLDAGWDLEILSSEIKALDNLNFDLTLTGFTADELGDLTLKLNPEPAGSSEAGEMNTIVQFNIVFDDESQQELWFKFVRRLKATFPDDETLGARLAKFIAMLESGAIGPVLQ
jgi:hypothetical protein